MVRPSPADGAPQGPLCGSGQEDPPTHPANGGHTSCFHFLFVLGVGPALVSPGKPFCPAFSSHWGVDGV